MKDTSKRTLPSVHRLFLIAVFAADCALLLFVIGGWHGNVIALSRVDVAEIKQPSIALSSNDTQRDQIAKEHDRQELATGLLGRAELIGKSNEVVVSGGFTGPSK